MKVNKCRKAPRRLNDKGFSLVELLISIAVLVIIMVPLMNNFFRSMQMNKRAEKLQIQSNLAASIMEGLKATDITTIIDRFHGVPENFDIISEDVNFVSRLNKIAEGQYEYLDSTIEQAPYYFAIHGIHVGSTAYDALITIDSDAEKYKKAGTSTMNLYPMPEVINLDTKANGLVFSNGTSDGVTSDVMDNAALDNFVAWGTAYAQTFLEQTPEYLTYLDDYDKWMDTKEQIMMTVPTPVAEPTPPAGLVMPTLTSYASSHPELDFKRYFDRETIKQYTSKTMKLTVNDKTLEYDIEYSCSWPAGSNIQSTISNQISVVKYARAVENVYLFYEPSIYMSSHSADKVVIYNEITANPVNLFVAKQGLVTLTHPITIQRIGTNLSAFTDIPGTGFTSYIGDTQETGTTTVNSKVVKTKEEDRIYYVTIKICSYAGVSTPPAERYQKVLYKLESTMIK
jgi:prepilin-type N-terminal cleavage/methylation domain-containing protein